MKKIGNILIILFALIVVMANADTVCIKISPTEMICTDDSGNEEYIVIMENYHG